MSQWDKRQCDNLERVWHTFAHAEIERTSINSCEMSSSTAPSKRWSPAFYRIKIEPYIPIRRELLRIIRQVNRKRARHGFEPVPTWALRLRRSVVRHSSGFQWTKMGRPSVATIDSQCYGGTRVFRLM